MMTATPSSRTSKETAALPPASMSLSNNFIFRFSESHNKQADEEEERI